ncbi:WD40 repeat domain-containing protein [[Actinomadura] parvosata]|uniref:WD40 repeat domain-containing protein n=1 Tax=[Actinomadura] parvosata TaxID=1955412 RepID=UPI00406CBBC9
MVLVEHDAMLSRSEISPEIRQQGYSFGDGDVYQAGRDQHIHIYPPGAAPVQRKRLPPRRRRFLTLMAGGVLAGLLPAADAASLPHGAVAEPAPRPATPSPRSAKAFPGFSGQVSAAACSPDGRRVAFGTKGGRLGVWNLSSPKRSAVCPVRLKEVIAVAFSPDGSLLATSEADGGRGDGVKLWRYTPGSELDLVTSWRRGAEAWALTFHPGGEVLVSGGNDEEVHCFGVTGDHPSLGTLGHAEELGLIWHLTFNRDGTSLLAGSAQGSIHRWDTKVGTPADWTWSWRTEPGIRGISGGVCSLATSPDGTALVSGSLAPDGSILLWKSDDLTRPLANPRSLAVYPHGKVYSVDFAADGTLVAASKSEQAAGGGQRAATLWERPYRKGKTVAAIENSDWVRFVPGTRELVATTGESQPILVT